MLFIDLLGKGPMMSGDGPWETLVLAVWACGTTRDLYPVRGPGWDSLANLALNIGVQKPEPCWVLPAFIPCTLSFSTPAWSTCRPCPKSDSQGWNLTLNQGCYWGEDLKGAGAQHSFMLPALVFMLCCCLAADSLDQ